MRNLVACLAILALVGAASAATITAPTTYLLYNAANQTVTITCSGGELIAGAKLWVQIGTGQSCPEITDIDLTGAGLIFAGEIDVYTDYTSFGYPGLAYADVARGSGNTPASGNLAIVHIDTTGFSPGPYDLKIQATLGGSSALLDDFGNPIGATLYDGQIAPPEPSTLVLLGFGGLGVLIRRRR